MSRECTCFRSVILFVMMRGRLEMSNSSSFFNEYGTIILFLFYYSITFVRTDLNSPTPGAPPKKKNVIRRYLSSVDGYGGSTFLAVFKPSLICLRI